MSAQNDAQQAIEEIKKTMLGYAKKQFPQMAGNKALLFIHKNFQTQGWNGDGTTKPWPKRKGSPAPNAKKRALLVKTGRLRASIHKNVQSFKATIYTDVPYAKVHNEGFFGTLDVAAHQRRRLGQVQEGTGRFNKNGKERMKKVTVELSRHDVDEHKRDVNIAQRQFMPESPTGADAPALNKEIREQIIIDLQNILK
jgi:phage gpG-like protein